MSLIPLRITFSMIGKFGIAGAFGVVYLYTPEVFPTTLRSLQGYASLGFMESIIRDSDSCYYLLMPSVIIIGTVG